MRLLPFIGVALVVLVVLIASTVFRVDERKQALVLQFGQVRQVITEPGLGIKYPFIQEVVFYEDRILPLETESLEVTPADERRLIVDAFARWRIEDVVRFRQSVQTEVNATQRLERILNAALREVLGSVQSSDVLSPERTVLMTRIRDAARAEAEALGVQIIDVRIRRADLPEQNLQATFNRMEAERQREAADERARGKERAQEIRATADREAVELVSDAERQAQVIRGTSDAERNAIYASAYGRDEEFFAFYRSLTAYERALTGETSTMVISPDSEFFDYLKSDRGAFSSLPAQPVVRDGEVVAPGEAEPGIEPDEGASAPAQPGTGSGEDEQASTAPSEPVLALEPLPAEPGAVGTATSGQADTETVTEGGVTITRTIDGSEAEAAPDADQTN